MSSKIFFYLYLPFLLLFPLIRYCNIYIVKKFYSERPRSFEALSKVAIMKFSTRFLFMHSFHSIFFLPAIVTKVLQRISSIKFFYIWDFYHMCIPENTAVRRIYENYSSLFDIHLKSREKTRFCRCLFFLRLVATLIQFPSVRITNAVIERLIVFGEAS